ncbi:MAG: energy transducer TonB [Terriglobales bacterium]|nr:energy transducer TonB [Terriglobales bacterium]
MNNSSNAALEIADPPEIRPRPMRVSAPAWGPVSMLPDRRPPWKEFVFSIGSQSVLVVILLWIGLLHPHVLTPPPRDYHFIRLVSTPHPVNHEPAPIRLLKAPPILEVKSPEALRLPPAIVRVEHKDPPAVPKIEIASKLPQQPAVTVIPKPIVKTNVFSTGSSQAPTIEKPPQQVQTGGFGDPRGVATPDNKNRPVTIARQGSFDLPTGAGYGNGSGGQHGARGVVASSGFGDGQAKGDAAGPANRTISQGAFGDAQSVEPGQGVAKSAPAVPHIKPAEILSKPVPAYTEEARKLHIEGEVLLEVVFEGTGSIRVVRVVHGLGHGLDESAIKAAQQIRFTPAQKDGQPVDSSGVLHIMFQLA